MIKLRTMSDIVEAEYNGCKNFLDYIEQKKNRGIEGGRIGSELAWWELHQGKISICVENHMGHILDYPLKSIEQDQKDWILGHILEKGWATRVLIYDLFHVLREMESKIKAHQEQNAP